MDSEEEVVIVVGMLDSRISMPGAKFQLILMSVIAVKYLVTGSKTVQRMVILTSMSTKLEVFQYLKHGVHFLFTMNLRRTNTKRVRA